MSPPFHPLQSFEQQETSSYHLPLLFCCEPIIFEPAMTAWTALMRLSLGLHILALLQLFIANSCTCLLPFFLS